MFNRFTGGKKADGAGGMATAGANGSGKRLLTLELLGARNIMASSKNGKSDPSATACLMDLGGREIKKESFSTKTKKDTLDRKPLSSVRNTYDLDTTEDLPTLQISVFHKPQFSVSDVLLGVASILLDNLDPSGAPTDTWLSLEPSGRVVRVSGEVHVRLSFNRNPTSQEVSVDTTPLLEGDEEAPAEDEEGTEPNELHVFLLKARKLIAADIPMFGGAGSSDPRVRVEIEGFEKKRTKHIRKTLNPEWNEELVWQGVCDPALSIKVTVEDYNDIKPAVFLGRVFLPLAEYDSKKPVQQTLKLRNKLGEADGTDRGEIDIRVHWKFNVKVKEAMLQKKKEYESSAIGKLSKGFSVMGRTLGVTEAEDDVAEDEDMEKEQQEVEKPKTAEQKEEEKKKEEEKLKELSDIEIKEGDYQVQVHIIEARDVKAANYDGTSDPIVYVECFGQKRNTHVIKGVTSCVFDELFIFNMPKLEKSTFEEGVIRISCFDSGVMGTMNTMIGAYAFDATMVYTANKDHELYRKWVALMNDESSDDNGVQGYLKITVAIVGPGDKIKVHDEDKERADEIAKEAAAGGDIGTMVLAPPTVIKEWKYIVVDLFKMEGLPIMDGKVGAGIATLRKAGTDAFMKLSFAGGKPLKSPVKTVKAESRAGISPIFNVQLWYPVSVPTMTQIIKMGVFDKDDTGEELIGNIIAKFNALKMSGGELPLRWYNMYGAPEFKQGKMLDNLEKGAKELAKKAKQTMGADINWDDYYNNTPDKASSFKGRALMRIRLMDKPPPSKAKEFNGEVKPFRLQLATGLKTSQEPPETKYILQALIITGNDLPKMGKITNDQLRIRVCIGIDEISTKPVKFENGMCRWNEFIRSEKLELPIDCDQLPDIFIYLLKEDLKPICFARFSSTVTHPDNKKMKIPIGFSQPPSWVLLQEDKSIDALDTGIFPGQVLMKLGFGLAENADACRAEWNGVMEAARKGSPYQLRVHLYQGRNLPPADSNGLCDPFVTTAFMGVEKTSKKLKKTLFPTYYQSHVFNDVLIPEYGNFALAPQVTFRLYDQDMFNPSEYLGTCNFNLKDAQVTPDPDTPLLDPMWKKLFYEVPGDSQGELLVFAQLIPTQNRKIEVKEEMIDITPATREAFIEFIVIGIRDMAPYNFQEMQNPFMEIELQSFGTAYKSATAPSKRPAPSNPNYLEKIVMPVRLPEKSIFSTPLSITARDTRLGGYLKPIVGVCQIDLSTKMPWDESTYVAPRMDLFAKSADNMAAPAASGDSMAVLPGQNFDETAMKAKEFLSRRDGAEKEDDFIALHEPAKLNEYIKDRIAADDTGAGVFGALNHINTDGSAKRKARPEDAFSDPDLIPDEGDQPPAWSIDRSKLESELEEEFKTVPFETYSLIRGKVNGFLGSTLKTVGRLKGLVRVIMDKDEKSLLPEKLMSDLMKPQSYVIRLYALRGVKLEALDTDFWGNKSNSDPYLKVKLGKKVFDDRENAVDDCVDVDFYKFISFDTELPGISQLRVQVYDKDLIGGDDLIGGTIIDLEDRWFDERWQQWGLEHMIKPGEDKTDPSKVRYAPKPVERRTLYAPGVSMGRGVLECWVDIMTAAESSTFPPDDVSLPPTQTFEVRVVIWKTKNVPPMDSFEGMSDLFVKAWPEGCDKQETDTHWRCKKGKASFNWRMLFDVEIGHNTRAMKFPYFHLQLWDRDLLKWSDCAGEGMIDLGRYYRKAYKRGIAIKLFEKKKGAAAKRESKKEKKKRGLVQDIADDIPPDEVEDSFLGEEKKADDNNNGVTISPMTQGYAQTKGAGGVLPVRDDPDSDDDDDNHHDNGIGSIPSIMPKKENKMLLRKPEKKVKPRGLAPLETETPAEPAGPSIFERLQFWKKKEDKKGDEAPLLGEDGQPTKTEEEHKQDDDDSARDFVNTIKNMTGLWDIDPDDSTWYHLENRDKNDPTKVTPMGSICYSIQIWPKDKATVMPVGASRSEPNTNPFLPPPVGRLQFSFNPFVMGSALCGPKLCSAFFCCLICMAFILLMIFCQPFLNIIINLIFVVY